MLHVLRRLVKETIMSHRIARLEVVLEVYRLGPQIPPGSETKIVSYSRSVGTQICLLESVRGHRRWTLHSRLTCERHIVKQDQ